jgi:hypothetical protein
MWIFLNDAFLSIVAHRDKPGFVLVRARRPGDIERALQPKLRPYSYQVEETPDADYRYRAVVPAEAAAEWIAESVRNITYDNFKNSIRDHEYHGACGRVWQEMLYLQQGGKYNYSLQQYGLTDDHADPGDLFDDDESPFCDCSVHWDELEMAQNKCAACGRPIN